MRFREALGAEARDTPPADVAAGDELCELLASLGGETPPELVPRQGD